MIYSSTIFFLAFNKMNMKWHEIILQPTNKPTVEVLSVKYIIDALLSCQIPYSADVL